jgi:hypothetical protein
MKIETIIKHTPIRENGYAMPAVNVSHECMDDIDEIKEHTEWNPTKKEVVGKAVKHYKESEMGIDESE